MTPGLGGCGSRLAFILPSLAAAISFLSRRGLAGPPPSGGLRGALGAVRCRSAPPAPSPAVPPLQLAPSQLCPETKRPVPGGVRPPPLAGPARVPPAGIAPGAGSPSRPGQRPAPDFPRSDFSSANEGEGKKDRRSHCRSRSLAGGPGSVAHDLSPSSVIPPGPGQWPDCPQ